jgi:serine/threonine protein kinase/WD40 repeat protein
MQKPSSKSPGQPDEMPVGSVRDAKATEETLCGSAGATADLDELLRQAANVVRPIESDEQQCSGLIHRLRDVEFVRRQSRRQAATSVAGPLAGTLGAFELLECLGEGGMGAVYRAQHLRLGKMVAVKVMHAHRLDDTELRSRFYREMRVLGQLQHPNIVAAQHADEVDGVPYLAMEYVDGVSLSSLLSEAQSGGQRISVAAVCELIRQASEGIQYAHQQGILHRDLKPGNLMLDRQGRVRVLDLGLAQMAETIDPNDSNSEEQQLTGQHQILGTPGYMAPEQLTRGHKMSAQTDVYALGATMYFLLTGRRVHSYASSESILEHALKVITETAPDIRTLRSDVPDELAVIIARCLEREPNARLGSAGELAEALKTWANRDSLAELWPELTPLPVSTSATTVPIARTRAAFPSQISTPDGDAETLVIPPTKGSSGGRGAVPPTIGWLWPAGMLCAILLAGVFIKLLTPDGGELIIQSDDPDARIFITAVQGEHKEELRLVEAADKSYTLTQGEWQIRIEGADASGFELSRDSVVISPGGRHEVRVTRRSAAEVAADSGKEKTMSDTALVDRSDAEKSAKIAPADSPSAVELQPQQQPVAVARHNGTNSWKPGRLDRLDWGYVAQPADLDDVFTWQMQLLRPPTGLMAGWENDRRASLDPRGELVAWSDEYGMRVARLDDGRIVQFHQHADTPPDKLPWNSIQFSPSGDRIVLTNSQTVDVRGRTGRLESRFAIPQEFLRYPHSWSNAKWMPDGERILIFSPSCAGLYSIKGEALQVLSFFDEAKPSWVASASVHPKQDLILFSGSRPVVQKWNTETGELQDLISLKEANSHEAVWTPAGNQILTMPRIGGSGPALWDADGTLIVEGKTEISYQAWSPDGRFLVDGTRRIFSVETLEPVKTLNLPERHPNLNSYFVPFWPKDDRIVLVSIANTRICLSGAVLQFHPSGRLLPSFNFPQPLGVGSASLSKDGSLKVAHLSGGTATAISQWEKDGQPEQIAFSDVWQPAPTVTQSWNPVSEEIAITRYPGAVQILNPNGETVRSKSMSGQYLMWSGDGRRLCIVTTDPDHPLGRIFVYGDTETPEFVSEPLKAHVFSPTWSADGRWLAWDIYDEAKKTLEIHILDVNSKEKTIHRIAQQGTGLQRWMAFSPDSQWLAVLRNEMPTRTATVIHMPDLVKFEVPQNSDSWSPTTSNGCWSLDSRRVLLGELFDVDVEKGLTKVGTLQCDPARPMLVAFAKDQDHLWLDDRYGQRLRVMDSEAKTLFEFGTSARLYPGHSDPFQARLRDSDSLVFRGSAALTSDVAVFAGLINLQEPGIRWTGIAFDDGQQISLSPGGEILSGPKDIDRYFVHTIRYPGGCRIPVTREGLLDRCSASSEQRAMMWASDLQARVLLEGRDEPWTTAGALPVSEYPDAGLVRELDVSGFLEISDAELVHIARFVSLQTLKLSHTTLSQFPEISGLSQLESVDLSWTAFTSVESVPNKDRLRNLNLSGLKLDDSMSQHLSSLTNLESLDLSHTPLTGFSALELRSLTNLKRLDVRETQLTEVDVVKLRENLPGCEVLFEQNESAK